MEISPRMSWAGRDSQGSLIQLPAWLPKSPLCALAGISGCCSCSEVPNQTPVWLHSFLHSRSRNWGTASSAGVPSDVWSRAVRAPLRQGQCWSWSLGTAGQMDMWTSGGSSTSCSPCASPALQATSATSGTKTSISAELSSQNSSAWKGPARIRAPAPRGITLN